MSEKNKGVDQTLMQLMYRPCRTKDELRNWLKVFLKLDLPDTTIDPDSTSNPLDMIWRVYSTAVWYDSIPVKERNLRSIFFAARGTFKSITSAATELLIMLHTGRETIHLAATIAQAANAYNKYFRMFLQRPYIKEAVISSILSKTTLKNSENAEVDLRIIPCTMQATSGPRANLIAMDEIDKIRGDQMGAYHNIQGMLTTTHDKKLPIVFGISTRDSTMGLIQKEIDDADKTGTKVGHWNLLDITEKCPVERSGTEEIKIYIKNDTLIAISSNAYDALGVNEQLLYTPHYGFKGCLDNCKLFSVCKTCLKQQTSKCKWLKTIESTQSAILSATSEDFVFTQLLCKKPPKTGLVYADFEAKKNVKTAAEMYEIFCGEPTTNPNMTSDDLIDIFNQYGIDCYMGVDAGFHNPSAILLFIDKNRNVYIMKEYMPVEVDSEELALWLFNNWKKYAPKMCFVDPENPDCTRLIKRRGFKVSIKVDKNRKPGVATVKGILRIPMTDKTQLFLHEDCYGVRQEFGLYKYRRDAAGNYLDDPSKDWDHAMDAIRYILHTLFTVFKGQLDYGKELPSRTPSGQVYKLPTGTDLSAFLGHVVHDNRHILTKDDQKGEQKRKHVIQLDFLDFENKDNDKKDK